MTGLRGEVTVIKQSIPAPIGAPGSKDAWRQRGTPPRGIGDIQGGLKGQPMTHGRFVSIARALAIATVAFATFCAAGVSHLSAAASPRASQDHDGDIAASDWRDASPAAVFALAFQAIGCDGPTALRMATFESRRLGLTEEGADRDVAPLDWKNSNLHAVLYDSMLAHGYEPPMAMTFTDLAYERITGQTLIARPFHSGEWFQAHLMYLIYCDAEGTPHQITAWTQNGCIDRLYESECADRIPDCSRGEHAWFEVRRSEVNPSDGPSPGSFAYVRWRRVRASVPEGIGARNCDDFIELDPIDCDAIRIQCGDRFMGPQGCPDGE